MNREIVHLCDADTDGVRCGEKLKIGVSRAVTRVISQSTCKKCFNALSTAVKIGTIKRLLYGGDTAGMWTKRSHAVYDYQGFGGRCNRTTLCGLYLSAEHSIIREQSGEPTCKRCQKTLMKIKENVK